jgi:hypothetical protein
MWDANLARDREAVDGGGKGLHCWGRTARNTTAGFVLVCTLGLGLQPHTRIFAAAGLARDSPAHLEIASHP